MIGLSIDDHSDLKVILCYQDSCGRWGTHLDIPKPPLSPWHRVRLSRYSDLGLCKVLDKAEESCAADSWPHALCPPS